MILILACYVISRIDEQRAEFLENYHENHYNEAQNTADNNDLHSDEDEEEVIQDLNEPLINADGYSFQYRVSVAVSKKNNIIRGIIACVINLISYVNGGSQNCFCLQELEILVVGHQI